MPTNIIDSIQLSGVTYTLQGSGGGGTVSSAITSGDTNAVESSAIYDATHVDLIELWTSTDKSTLRDTTQSLYKFYVQYTGDTALDEQVTVEIGYGSNNTWETLSGNVFQETATTSSVFTSTFDNGKWIIESSSPNYIKQIYADYRFRIWTYNRTIGNKFAADSIENDIIPYIGEAVTKAENAFAIAGLTYNGSKELGIFLSKGNGNASNVMVTLDDLKYSNQTLSTDIQIPTGEVGWMDFTPSDNCLAGDIPTNKVKVTYSGQTVSASARRISFQAYFKRTDGNASSYYPRITWSDTTTPTVDGCSAVTATYDSTDDSVIIELPNGETTYDGNTGTFSIKNLISDSCQFDTGISSVKYYGDIAEDIYTAMAHKQDTLSAGTGIQISGNVISATGGGGGTVSSAITSGDTNAVAGGAVYDKFDEVEQVTARALNDLDEKINPTVELTQAEYDALVTAGTVSADTYYLITDATPVDVSQYWTSAQTQSAINQATSGKVNTSSVVSSVTSASTDSEIPTAKAVWEAASGGGKAVSGGTNISITTGETADTINCTLPIIEKKQTKGRNIVIPINESYNGNLIDRNTFANNKTSWNLVKGEYNTFGSYFEQALYNNVFGNHNILEGNVYSEKCVSNFVVGDYNFFGTQSSGYAISNSAVFGEYNNPKNNYEYIFGKYNNSVSGSSTFGDSGNTLFSVGNGTADNARHNAFEIRQNGDIYLSLNGQDVKLQDQLGGSSITVDTALDSGSTNPVENRVIYNKIDEIEQVTAAALNNINDRLSEDEEVTAAGLNALNDNFGGLKLVKLTQAEYNALVTKDSSTLYVIVD